MVILHKTGDMWAIKSIVALRTEFWYNIEGLSEILYLIFDYLHKHYTFERFEV